MNQHPANSNQGRIGMESVNASRAIFGMRPITEDEPIEIPLFLRVLCVLSAIFVVLMHSGLLDPFLRHF